MPSLLAVISWCASCSKFSSAFFFSVWDNSESFQHRSAYRIQRAMGGFIGIGHEGGWTHLSADLYRHLRQGRLREAGPSQDADHGRPDCRRNRSQPPFALVGQGVLQYNSSIPVRSLASLAGHATQFAPHRRSGQSLRAMVLCRARGVRGPRAHRSMRRIFRTLVADDATDFLFNRWQHYHVPIVT